MSSSTNSSSPDGMSTMDILAASFFVIAGAWLLTALVYSTLVLLFLRMRAAGTLGNVYEPDFGRVYLCGRPTATTAQTRRRWWWCRQCQPVCYIPLGRIFRRYIAHLEYDNHHGDSNGGGPPDTPVHFMTRPERRAAMEQLLIHHPANNNHKTSNHNKRKQQTSPNNHSHGKEQIYQSETTQSTLEDPAVTDVEQGVAVSCADTDNNNDDDEPAQCSICLGELYEYDTNDTTTDPPLAVTTCRHEFHRDCILDWLERQANIECPCCRVPMISQDAVWQTVHQNRRLERRKQQQRLRQQQKMRRQPQQPSQQSQPLSADPQEHTSTTEREEEDDDDEMIVPVIDLERQQPPQQQQSTDPESQEHTRTTEQEDDEVQVDLERQQGTDSAVRTRAEEEVVVVVAL